MESKQVGPELDAEVAAKVFGWTDLRLMPRPNYFAGFPPNAREHNLTMQVVPPYSTNMSVAMGLIVWLCPSREEYNAGRKSCRFIMRQQDDGSWWVEARSPFLTSYDTPAFADSSSLAEAICRAALAALAQKET